MAVTGDCWCRLQIHKWRKLARASCLFSQGNTPHNLKVVGSNPTPATIHTRQIKSCEALGRAIMPLPAILKAVLAIAPSQQRSGAKLCGGAIVIRLEPGFMHGSGQ